MIKKIIIITILFSFSCKSKKLTDFLENKSFTESIDSSFTYSDLLKEEKIFSDKGEDIFESFESITTSYQPLDSAGLIIFKPVKSTISRKREVAKRNLLISDTKKDSTLKSSSFQMQKSEVINISKSESKKSGVLSKIIDFISSSVLAVVSMIVALLASIVLIFKKIF